MLNKLPTNWDLKKIDDVANIYLGLTYTPTYTESGVPFLSVKDLNDTYLDFEKSKFISYEEYKNATENAKPKKGDIIFGRVGTLGNPLIIETDIEFCIFVSLGFFRIKDNSCEPNFLASWMKSPLFHKQVDNIVAGGAQKNLNTGWLKNFLIPIPPIPEQKAIAQVLSAADAAIHTTEKLIAQKELRKKWLMQQLLTGKKRLKGFEEAWKKERLEKYLIKHDEKSTENNQYPVLTSSRKGIFLQSDYYTRDVASEDNTGYNVVPRGYFTYRHMSDDLIFKFNINDIVDKGIVSTLYPVFTTKDINSYFLLVKLNEGSEFKMHAKEQKQGGSRTYVYFKTLCQLKLNLPSLEEQNAIAQVLQVADKEISLLRAKAEKLREQKKGMMQVLLTGKVRLKID